MQWPSKVRRSGAPAAIVGALAAALCAPAVAGAAATVVDGHAGVEVIDVRRGHVAPSARQRAAVSALGARATWNRFGTPSSLINDAGWLATGLDRRNAVRAARTFVTRNAALFRLSGRGARALRVVADNRMAGTAGHAVLFRQRAGGLDVVQDGTLVVGVTRGRVAYASSTLAGDLSAPAAGTLSATAAWVRAAASAGIAAGEITNVRRQDGWTAFDAANLTGTQRARLVAVAMPGRTTRAAFESLVVDDEDTGEVTAFTAFVDARSGQVLVRDNRVDQLADAPRWKYFTAYPPLDYSTSDNRIIGCFNRASARTAPGGCSLDLHMDNRATPFPWDTLSGAPTFTTRGNNAQTALSSASPFTPGENYSPVSPTREYIFPWANKWYRERCNAARAYASPERADMDAAITNLFANHNRMHDWSYRLGFTERNFNMQVNNFGRGGRPGDPELGDAQAGVLTGGPPTYTGRDNANQITPNDGIPPITNMYLWQPIAGAFYPPCVDGDFDMSVIGHEYTHAISNRMVGGPDAGLSSDSDGQARAMGESWSDLTAVEYLLEYGYTPDANENPFAVGAYVTGNQQRGIRNYGMNRSPLNYSNVQGYDGSGGRSPHDDGEIWSAANYDIRQALNRKYNRRFPSSDRALQRACADGDRAATRCPGNRRWMQIVFDAYLLMPPRVSMLGARDAYLAAEKMRFGGRERGLLWREFARRGFGFRATTRDTNDPNPRPSFESPVHADEGSLQFHATAPDGSAAARAAGARAAARSVDATVFVGDYEGNVTPVADTDPGTLGFPRTVRLVPGTYRFIVRARGQGAVRFTHTVRAGSSRRLTVSMPTNWASRFSGGQASGEGVNKRSLIDDTEATNWAVRSREPDVRGAQVTVDLGGGVHTVSRINVSAMLRTADNRNEAREDPGSQSRFSALRQFEILTCTASATEACTGSTGYRSIYTSSADAFPAGVPRPLSPVLSLRGFDVPDTRATHVRLRVLHNQCTGAPAYQGDQDDDPLNETDCEEGSSQDRNVRAAELQVFSRAATMRVGGERRRSGPQPRFTG